MLATKNALLPIGDKVPSVILVRLLCCVLLRIRRAGYPIRHSFEEFVERYRVLIPGLTLSDVKDFKYTSKMICNRVMEGHDWQIGYTKVFLKVCG